MTTLNDVQVKMNDLLNQIDHLLAESTYDESDDLSELNDYIENRVSAEGSLILDTYSRCLNYLDNFRNELRYIEKEIIETGTLFKNENGLFSLDSGFTYPCGSKIEYLLHHPDGEQRWCTGTVKFDGEKFHLLDDPETQLQGLFVRRRA